MCKRIAKAAIYLGVLLALTVAVIAPPHADPLADSFTNPPSSARPQVWWHWVNGNISKPGITADLEAMKRVGIGGGTICNLGAYAAPGDAHFNSDEWWDDTKFAMTEAARLGLELGVENCEGWSSSGGPWIKPEDAMKMLVWSEARVKGGAALAGPLAQPLTRHDFYRDVAVLAFPTIASEAGPSLADLSPKMTASGKPVNVAALMSGDVSKYVTIPAGTADNPGLLIDCAGSFTADAIRFSYKPHNPGGTMKLESSDDGVTWKKAAMFGVPGEGVDWICSKTFAPVTARYFRISYKVKPGRINGIEQPERLNGIELAMFNLFGPDSTKEAAVPVSNVVDISSSMKSDGTLAWTAPAGNWTVVRFGYTAIGAVNHPASKYGIGLECDKLSKIALEHHFAGLFDRVMATGATVPGRPLQWSLIDSYEVGPQNWTDNFPGEFKARTGYAITPWLVTLTGRPVASLEQTRRFEFDFTRTISELWDTNYWGYFAVLLHQHGLKAQVEAYGDGAFDTLRSSGLVDMPMSEFWYPGQGDVGLARKVASAAHLYGHTLVGAESFTAGGKYFSATPWNLKREGDGILAAGVNRYYFHSGAHQPWTDGRAPGMTWAFGMFQNRNNTWYETGKDYFRYLARCESLLQQGRFIGDILAYEGAEGNGRMALQAPRGYAADQIDTDLLMESLTVENGILSVPSGQRYRMLALPNSTSISLPVLKKIDALVHAGAIVFGPRPEHSLGLTGYPESETEVAKIAGELWGKIDGQATIKNNLGKGCVYWTGDSKKISLALDDLRIAPDFSYDAIAASIPYLHRRINTADAYFLSNQVSGAVSTNATFRVTGKLPEIWDPQKGTLADAPVWSADGSGGTVIPLQLAPGQSLFVVFRKPAPKNHLVSVAMKSSADAEPESKQLVITKAIYGDIAGHGGVVDITAKLSSLIDKNQLVAAIGNDLVGSDPAPMIVKSATVEYTVGGVPGTISVGENDMVTLPPYQPGKAKFAVVQSSKGQARLIPWAAGLFTVKDAAGKAMSKDVASTPASIAVDGPWTLHFDPRWGGPQTATFDSLTDWTKRPEPGIKYYSGTAEYDKTINVPNDWFKAGRVAYLDLGDLESLANVTLNGRDLGCLWSPPYRIDVTGILKPGDNALQIKVTDTWVNRLIGDASLTAEQRVTFTTQQFYSADDPLIPSGLFGPVTVIGADPIDL
ncbi:MAG: glycosyl hydrolase [Capsulimonadaceae bacterium]|nr:glycosyl hydrolase [Capsulimonadaceae bacterium]